MNEAIFFAHVILTVIFTFVFLKMGKEALAAFVGLQGVIANLFVLKQITLFGLDVTPSDAFIIAATFGLNLQQEFFGKECAKKTVWISFLSLVFFAVMSQIHLFYTPSLSDQSQVHFVALLSPAPRLFIASITSFFLVQRFDLFFFGFLKSRLPSVKWQWRNLIALVLSQLLDTVCFSFLGLYGLVSSVSSVILISFTIKLLIILMLPILTTLAKRCLPHEI